MTAHLAPVALGRRWRDQAIRKENIVLPGGTDREQVRNRQLTGRDIRVGFISSRNQSERSGASLPSTRTRRWCKIGSTVHVIYPTLHRVKAPPACHRPRDPHARRLSTIVSVTPLPSRRHLPAAPRWRGNPLPHTLVTLFRHPASEPSRDSANSLNVRWIAFSAEAHRKEVLSFLTMAG
ncbi:hypothetical protein M427DRAFT_244552 [Gonapodya prolifera JEL478]|uniref:Uncharacterized protein n=1 Tax=Gonapodya prolifera (strain JEL478) TaxID=1344416 RepID=A0A139ALQ3_GONPJ|nr:hypothetical protein M427DRAFT_244552 [Gonapodya prolifera JEL478]|eukprot:KXS17716.1 hypothetical protein M427DRAFT_244552 [Gonapodya prolifera JEL478]